MKTIIIGAGEIGRSLYEVLVEHYDVFIFDKEAEELEGEKFEVMHVCFPYSEDFIEQVRLYKIKFNPKHLIIHSTVPVGTSRKLGAIHSPCIGIHPHLGESLKTFTKFLGGEDASFIAQYFRRAGIKIYMTDKQETTELMKICSTSFYGVCIEWTKEVKRLCDLSGVPFEMWTLWTEDYNKGYAKLGYPEYQRPNLTPIKTKIGGHCVIPNLKFLDSKFKEILEEGNEI